MKYEKGDKVVVEIDKEDADMLNVGHSPYCLYFEQFLGKLEDFTESKKIKMTVEEKKEFDNLPERFEHSTADLNDFLDAIWDYPKVYPVLHKRLFENAKVIINRKKQFEFARALENPDLIEVEGLKKYYIHLFPSQSSGYLNKNKEDGYYFLGNKPQNSYFQTQFTKDEIAKIPQDAFKITDKALEEVEEDE